MKTILLFGLRRSGNHFIISTILQQYTNYVHINDVDLSFDKYNKFKNIEKDKERISRKWTGFKDVECVVISMENKLKDFDLLEKFNSIDDCYSIVLLRCPYSNFSSVWKTYNEDNDRLIEIRDLWKLYAKKVIEKNNFVKIIYDKYTLDDEYILERLRSMNIEIKNINRNKYINNQKSVFKSKFQKRTNDTLENCIYSDNVNFVSLIKEHKEEIDELWNSIMN